MLVLALLPSLASPPQVGELEYHIDCHIEADPWRLSGTEEVRFRNASGLPLERLLLAWREDADLTATFEGAALALEPAREELDPARVVALPRALEPGAEARLVLTFAAEFGPGGDELRLTDWHPRLADGRRHASFDVDLRYPAEFGLATSGALVGERYRADAVRTFGVFLTRRHEVLEARAGEVTVQCYFAPRAEGCARLLVATALETVAGYRERFGFYPQCNLTILPGAPDPVGGYPFATGMVVVHGMERFEARTPDYWRWILAHEIGHQYWSERVLADSPDGTDWLTIGLGLVADRDLCLERSWGDENQRAILERYRQGVRDGLDTTIQRTPEEVAGLDFDFNNVVVHGKGLAVCGALEAWLGRETFGRVERRALREFAGRVLDARAFQRLCESESGQDLAWFFDSWVRSNTVSSARILAQSCVPAPEGYRVEIEVESTGTMVMPVLIEARFEDGTRVLRWSDRWLRRQSLSLSSRSPLEAARLDPEDRLGLVQRDPDPTRPR